MASIDGHRPRACRLLLGCAVWLMFLAGRTAAMAAVPALPVVELPKFEVTDTRILPPLESWRHAELPGFEVLSNLPERSTRHFVRHFLLLQEVIGAIMPGLRSADTPLPTTVILCGGRSGFNEFLPRERLSEQFSTNTLFYHDAERSAIVVDFTLWELQLGTGVTEASDPFQGFYREYFRHLLRRQLASPPPWFEEGMVQLLAATDFDRRVVDFGRIGDGFGGARTGDFNQRLRDQKLIPLGELLQPGLTARRDANWAAQCYAFVHLCLYGDGRKYQPAFLKFLERISREELSEPLFKECFGKSYRDMGVELRGYLEFTAHTSVRFQAKKGHELPEPPAIVLQAAPDAVVGRVKGEVLRLAGRNVEARNALIAPYVRGERDPRLLAAIGLDERALGQDERARRFLEAAAAANVVRARAHLELARLRHAEARARAGGGGRFDADQMTALLGPLLIARAQPPRLAEVYELLAEVWMQSEAEPTREQFDAVLEGARLFPSNSRVLLATALLASERGFPAEARQLAEHGAQIASAGPARDRFVRLAAALAREAEKTSPPASPSLPP